MVRNPAVAGQFYPANPSILEKEVSSYTQEVKREDALGVLSPHAGYIYSGKVAGSVYSRINIPKDVIIIGPNHTGLGEPEAVMCSGTWQMPNGNIEINSDLAASIVEHSKYLKDDHLAHFNEHSLEVQIPFLQHFRKDLRIVPLTMMSMDYNVCLDIGHAVARAVKGFKEPVLIVASSDMTHYESDKSAREKDKKAIARALALDPEGLLKTVRDHRITMCGVIPATIMLIACKELGAKKAELVDYATSAETSGDYEHVVGYAGMIVK
ncbi:MAG: AmmeMemoRadiSam system protein B [Deltaproteobacteria bacterium]|nr:AmmeMemoRadiSam system protein B [Deltaproteobacteria bacterium]